MGITVSGKLNKPANERVSTSGDSSFFVSIGKRERDFKTQESVWVNYQAALFAKQGKQADYYRSVLAEGSIITVSGSGLLPRIWGDNNDQVSLSVQDSKLELAVNPNECGAPMQQSPQQAPQQAPHQFPPGYGGQQPAPQAQVGGFDDFDDPIPFSNYEYQYI